ncbi:11595_t:CDS:1, partial [Acaulospora morrowiae]
LNMRQTRILKLGSSDLTENVLDVCDVAIFPKSSREERRVSNCPVMTGSRRSPSL